MKVIHKVKDCGTRLESIALSDKGEEIGHINISWNDMNTARAKMDETKINNEKRLRKIFEGSNAEDSNSWIRRFKFKSIVASVGFQKSNMWDEASVVFGSRKLVVGSHDGRLDFKTTRFEKTKSRGFAVGAGTLHRGAYVAVERA